VNASARRLLKSAVDGICLVMAAPAAVMCAAETRLGPRAETMFTAWAQTFALVPGIAGVFLRRAFYRLTLEACGSSFWIGFGAMFTHRAATIEQDVYVGPYALIGSCRLGRGALVGSRSSILSGGSLHTLDASGRWAATDLTRLHRVDIGAYAWIGEASVIIADVGTSAMVAAGSVVSSAVPAHTMVGGNPARFVRRLEAPRTNEEVPSVSAAVPVR
jgi:acetyltransferase-like isoleucine patch superfamily enzyme